MPPHTHARAHTHLPTDLNPACSLSPLAVICRSTAPSPSFPVTSAPATTSFSLHKLFFLVTFLFVFPSARSFQMAPFPPTRSLSIHRGKGGRGVARGEGQRVNFESRRASKCAPGFQNPQQSFAKGCIFHKLEPFLTNTQLNFLSLKLTIFLWLFCSPQCSLSLRGLIISTTGGRRWSCSCPSESPFKCQYTLASVLVELSPALHRLHVSSPAEHSPGSGQIDNRQGATMPL